jgi:penicillin-binding protein 1A
MTKKNFDEEFDLREIRQKKEIGIKKKIRYTVIIVAYFIIMAFLGKFLASEILQTGKDHQLMTKLKNFKPKLITKVYDKKGQIIGTFSRETRELINYEDIPKSYIHAQVAVEDSRFFSHIGVDPIGVLKAIIDNISLKLRGRRMRGSSTLTMQLVRLITQNKEYSIKRKLTEMILAIQVESIFTKEEIFERYANQVYLGRNIYGIQAAARHYFSKEAAELTLSESAFIAGLVQRPNIFSNTKNIKAARNRRNHVLKRMYIEGYIDKKTYEETIKEPLLIAKSKKTKKDNPGAYFLEEVRKYLFSVYGMDAVLDDGLKVYTSLDLDLQKAAEKAIKENLKRLDKRQGFRLQDKKFVPENEIETYFSPTWSSDIQEGMTVEGVVLNSDKKHATIRIKNHKIKIGSYEIAWTKEKEPNKILSKGDVVLFKIHKFDPEKNKYNISLDQEPIAQSSLLAIDHHTGQIVAMVGGYSFSKSEFNRAWNEQAVRQTGSIFKPILFAAAIDSGFTLADTFFDEPTVFIDPKLFYVDENGEIQKYQLSEKYKKLIREGKWEEPEPYIPKNYHHSYQGLITLRKALEKSKNIVSVKLFNRVGAKTIISFAKKCGIKNRIEPYLSSALGSTSLTLKEVCRAYGTFAALGVKSEPYYILKVTDRYGKTLEENKPLKYRAISKDTAYLIISAMKGVIERGTGVRAKSLNLTLCGKTGTTDNYTDAWFVGSDPNLTLGVWVGFDKKKTLGERETGAKAALPAWIEFMKSYEKTTKKTDWAIPSGVIRDTVDIKTGLLVNTKICKPEDYFLETFKKGTEPYEYCNEQIHEMLGLPYYMQHGNNIKLNTKTGEVKENVEFIIYHKR